MTRDETNRHPAKSPHRGREEVERVFQGPNETRAFYTKISRFYDRLSERTEAPVRNRGLDLLGAKRGEKIVEVGFGTGHGLVALQRAVGREGRVVGVDLSEGMILQARRRLARSSASGSTALVCGSTLQLPLPDAWADALFSSFTLELFDSPDLSRVVSEWRRVVRPGGRLSVVSLSKRPNDLAVKAYEWAHRHFPNLADCRPIYVEETLVEGGFEIEHQELEHMWVPVEVVLARSPPGQRANPLRYRRL